LLEAILRRAPTHTPTLEKLLDFVLGAGDDRRTAELAAQLEHIHASRGDARSGERFGELRRRFQRAAGLTDEEIAAAVAAAMPQPVETVPIEEASVLDAAVAHVEVHEAPTAAPLEPAPLRDAPEVEIVGPREEAGVPEELDLSAEWASLLEEQVEDSSSAAVPASSLPPPAPAAEDFEIPEFPVESQPRAAAEARPPEAARAHTEARNEEFQIPLEPAPVDWEIPAPEQSVEPEVRAEEPAEVAAEGHGADLEEPRAATPEEPPQPDLELDQEFELVFEPEEVAAEAAEVVDRAASDSADSRSAERFSSDQFLSDLAKEIDELGLDELTPTMSKADIEDEIREPVEERAATSTETGPLKEVFDEFRAELGEMGAEDEDLETHYNLGIAFREMGLLEEAIGEFQKVAKANDRGKAFRYSMQCSTLLGLAFMEKGQPDIAAIWYERALHTPGLDSESKLALRYDLGVAQESAGDLEAALKSFSQVYAVNIDYRDVADRIASLQKPAR